MSESGGVDQTVTEFLELEEELSAGTRTTQTYEEGNIARANKIPTGDVPEGYPIPIETEQALRLDITVNGNEEVVTFLEWPGAGEQSDHVEQLLGALGHEMSEFADIYGDRVALDSKDGWHGIDAERTTALRKEEQANAFGGAQKPGTTDTTNSDESLDTTRNLLVGAVALGAAGAAGVSLTNSVISTYGALATLFAWIAIPAGIYLDASRVKSVRSWSPKTAGWVAGGLVPMFNVSFGVAYLLNRHVHLSRNTGASDVWYKAVVASLLTFPIALMLEPMAGMAAATLFGYGWMFMPLAVYFDAKYAGEETDWQPMTGLWTVATVFTWFFGATAYLLRRRSKVN